MAKRGIRKQEGERLDDATIARVIELFEPEEGKPITIKAACEILNINANGNRLRSIIDDYKSRLEHEKKMRKRLRGKPFDTFEIKYAVSKYLQGESIANIAKGLYRTTDGVKRILSKNNIPERDRNHDFRKPTMLPDEAVSKEFTVGEIAWSAVYNSVVEVRGLVEQGEKHGNVYRIYILNKRGGFASQPWYELGKLPILPKLGVTLEDFRVDTDIHFAYRID